MPNSGTAKTKSAPKHLLGWVVLGVALVTVVVVAFFLQDNRQAKVRLGAYTYTLYRAIGTAEHIRGLSGTPSLARDRGMLFWDDRVKEQCLWMRDMHYPLDMIWLDGHKKVVHIEQNVPPSSYPKTFCAQGQYLIEINAGEVARSGLKTGQTVAF